MRTIVGGCLLVAATACLLILGSAAPQAADDKEKGDAPAKGKVAYHYPDFGFLPPPNQYEGRVFHLSQNYPQEANAPVPDFATRDFDDVKKNWRQYLLDVRAYCFKGNTAGPNVEDDFDVAHNGTGWFHMPWQHFGPNGREGVHGLTKEAPVQPRQLAWSQTYAGGQAYAVGFYNALGGYTIGQVWKDHEHPANDPKAMMFPEGTVVFKLLFTDIPPAQVPSLNPPLQWRAYVTDNYASTNRGFKAMSLIQMDIMVKHKGSPNGWVFGNFQYNGQRPGADPKKPNWENLVPLGIQWGNDPENTDNVSNPQPITTVINPKLKETIINPDTNELPPTHLGWNSRLNGPLDNPMSSCMSCHMTAEAPQKSAISPLFTTNPPAPGSEYWMRWFKNVKCGEAFDEKVAPTDFSLQMAAAIQNFRTWRNEGSKLVADRYKSKAVPAKLLPLAGPAHVNPLTDEVEIRRNER
ncbi:MAG TPA: hypothetical protein VHR66_20975 [Gemmataceae bacterium]|jgi:hypothetical protein|nr:hypothetical protein [Gemmataceae bacterium]